MFFIISLQEWTLFVAKSGLVKFPEDLSKYPKALEQHKEKQREIRKRLEVSLFYMKFLNKIYTNIVQS